MKRDDLMLPLLAAAADVFPALAQQIHGHRLVYLDGAASKLMPQPVIDAVRDYQSRDHANVHRGVHTLSERATALFEEAREALRRFVNAASAQEIIFTRGATESLNMVARGLGERLRPGDEVIVSGLEHHANLVPWQMACARSGAVLRHIPVLDDGTLDALAFESHVVAARQGAVGDASLERARHRGAGAGFRGQGAAGGPRHRGRRRAGGRPRAGRRAMRWAAISTRFRATRCTVRPESAFSTDASMRSTPCRRGWAAAT